jgi:hypothetical protein
VCHLLLAPQVEVEVEVEVEIAVVACLVVAAKRDKLA